MRHLLIAISLLACVRETPPPPPPIPVALAVVMPGAEIWIGNELYETDENARYNGLLLSVREAWTRSAPAAALPADSHGMLVTYDTDASVRVPMRPLGDFDAAAFGEQIDYKGNSGNNVVAGLRLAVSELARVSATRRIVHVITDGYIDDRDGMHFDALRPLLALTNIEITTLIVRTGFAAPGLTRLALLGRAWTVISVERIASALNAAWGPPQVYLSASRRP